MLERGESPVAAARAPTPFIGADLVLMILVAATLRLLMAGRLLMPTAAPSPAP